MSTDVVKIEVVNQHEAVIARGSFTLRELVFGMLPVPLIIDDAIPRLELVPRTVRWTIETPYDRLTGAMPGAPMLPEFNWSLQMDTDSRRFLVWLESGLHEVMDDD
jgi:hypothetical protein